MDKIMEKIGELLFTYDGILNESNTNKICNFFLEDNQKILDLCELMIKKYKDNLSKELINIFILYIFIIYDKNSGIKNPDKCFTNLEKIIDEYSENLSNTNIQIMFNIMLKLYRIKRN